MLLANFASAGSCTSLWLRSVAEWPRGEQAPIDTTKMAEIVRRVLLPGESMPGTLKGDAAARRSRPVAKRGGGCMVLFAAGRLSQRRGHGSGPGWALGARAPPRTAQDAAHCFCGHRRVLDVARARRARPVTLRGAERLGVCATKLLGGRTRASLVGLRRCKDVHGCSVRA